MGKKKSEADMKNINHYMILGLGFFTLALAMVVSLTITSFDVVGANNVSTITRVNITNTEPTLYEVTIPSSIDLTPGNTTLVNCTGYVYDVNGWSDINTSNATLYDTTYGDGTTFDNNFRYQNNSCTCTQLDAEQFNATCTCGFNVLYYANNGTWQCNMTIADEFGLSDTRNSSYGTINTVIGINAPNEIDFGNLSVTETSSEIIANISNFGNVPINVSLRGYGGTDPSNQNNVSMVCEIGNITSGNERYAPISGVDYNNMINLTNITTMISNLTLPVRTDDSAYGNDTNSTYWRIYIPSSISGACNGTVEFYATDTS